ncbi:hypothetical protein BDZ94DRAFT_1278235 [Collybia nuda]|uniref:Uncharacterized protein n=1 Tax=Collybia nuda TaxID=64659 RepID=A0A9P5XPW5_9AGAR|nr:hypothetical protein BDZ94DRAFT_1278235 [Collybia nuda]
MSTESKVAMFTRLVQDREAFQVLVDKAVACDVDHPQFPKFQGFIGALYQSRFQKYGDIMDLGQAIIFKKVAIATTRPEKHSDLANLYQSLALTYRSAFDQTDRVESLDLAIQQGLNAIEVMTILGHDDLAISHDTLADSYMKRAHLLRDIDDISSALEHMKKAIEFMALDDVLINARYQSISKVYHTYSLLLNNNHALRAAIYYKNRAQQPISQFRQEGRLFPEPTIHKHQDPVFQPMDSFQPYIIQQDPSDSSAQGKGSVQSMDNHCIQPDALPQDSKVHWLQYGVFVWSLDNCCIKPSTIQLNHEFLALALQADCPLVNLFHPLWIVHMRTFYALQNGTFGGVKGLHLVKILGSSFHDVDIIQVATDFGSSLEVLAHNSINSESSTYQNLSYSKGFQGARTGGLIALYSGDQIILSIYGAQLLLGKSGESWMTLESPITGIHIVYGSKKTDLQSGASRPSVTLMEALAWVAGSKKSYTTVWGEHITMMDHALMNIHTTTGCLHN